MFSNSIPWEENFVGTSSKRGVNNQLFWAVNLSKILQKTGVCVRFEETRSKTLTSVGTKLNKVLKNHHSNIFLEPKSVVFYIYPGHMTMELFLTAQFSIIK